MTHIDPFPLADTIIRYVTEEDFSKIVVCDKIACYESNTTPPDHQPPRLTIDELKKIKNKNVILEGMFDKADKLIAYWFFELNEKELYIMRLAVLPDYRGLKIGTFILDRADNVAQFNNKMACTLSVDPFNEAGLSIYLKYGYRIISYIKSYFGDKYPQTDRFFMQKKFYPENLSDQKEQVRVDDVLNLQRILQEDFLGTSLIKSSDSDCKHNFVVFQKLKHTF